MYESPIKIIESTIDSFSKAIIKQRDDAIFAEIQSSFGVDLDREELIRALQYERNQYDKGYADGKADALAELVRCKDCKHWRWSENNLFGEDYGTCVECLMDTEKEHFCSYGERKDHD